MTVTPAYGRDYKSAKEVKADWKAGKDFVIADIFGGNAGRYINVQDAKNETIMVRYAKLSKIVQVQ
jgi:hypothetical protein